jgi:AAA15 family ATPase/GTPase
MHISSFQISNYKSYNESERITLKEGFNLIVGQNNAGKTSMLEALSLQFGSKPHKSEQTVPYKSAKYNTNSKIDLVISITKEDLIRTFRDECTRFIYPNNNVNDVTPMIERLNDYINSKDVYQLNCILHSGQSYIITLDEIDKPSHYGNNSVPATGLSYSSVENRFKVVNSNVNDHYANTLWSEVLIALKKRIYCFKAERLNVGESFYGQNHVLATNAANLPEVLNVLQSNRSRFNRFNKLLNQIFPQIHEVTVKPISKESLIINTWTVDPLLEREDLAIPLSESGTGIGQVLAILYIVVNSDSPQIIIIDEPQSFLHPGAARKLVEILKKHPQHQYIIATHSPTIISSSNPETITLIKTVGSETKVEAINKEEAKELKEALLEVGAKLSDVFGADNIIWVEGQTEERCFPIIVEELTKHKSLMGTSIVGMINTGDLEGRNKNLAYKIYTRLSRSTGLLPPAIAFIFDRETRTEKDIEDLERASEGKAMFLKRPMFENYLLNTAAIQEVLSSEGTDSLQVTEEDIEKWIIENKANKMYWKSAYKFENYSANDKWKEGIHAGLFLEEMFRDLTKSKLVYQKTKHSVKLTETIINKYPNDLRELSKLLEEILDKP